MADTIIIRCAHCGQKIGEISYIPGKQYVGCSCGKRTGVLIKDNGNLDTWETG